MWSRILVNLLAVACLAYGVYGLLSPEAAAALVSLEPTAVEGTGEIRAVYGGLMIAMGLLLFRGGLGGERARPWLIAVGVGSAGLFLGRLVSLFQDGVTGYTLLAAVLEGGIAGLLFVAASEARTSPEPASRTVPGPEAVGGSADTPSDVGDVPRSGENRGAPTSEPGEGSR